MGIAGTGPGAGEYGIVLGAGEYEIGLGTRK